MHFSTNHGAGSPSLRSAAFGQWGGVNTFAMCYFCNFGQTVSSQYDSGMR
jgi:hypothetical protein